MLHQYFAADKDSSCDIPRRQAHRALDLFRSYPFIAGMSAFKQLSPTADRHQIMDPRSMTLATAVPEKTTNGDRPARFVVYPPLPHLSVQLLYLPMQRARRL